MIKNRHNTRRGALSLAAAAILLSGCQVTISDPMVEAPTVEPSPTVVAVAVAPAAPTARASRTPRSSNDDPSPTPTLSPTATPEPRSYAVVQGDTLGIIARRFEVSVTALMAANNLSDGDTLSLGQILIIPSASQIVAVEAEAGTPIPTVLATDGNPIHFVKVGETLSAIAAQYGVSRDDLLAANGLRPDSQLTAGETLIIPTGEYTALPTATAVQSTPVPTIEVVLSLPTVTPTAENTPAASPTAAARTHVVATGEYAGAIARDAGVTVADLKAANPGVDLDKLAVGQSLVIPGGSGAAAPAATSPALTAPPTATPSSTPTPVPPVIVTHVVTEGDTFESVAAKYKVPVTVIKERNPSVTGELTPSVVIEVPIGTPTPTPTRTAPPTSTPLAMPYQAPVLLAPTDDTVWIHAPDKTPPMLLWTSVGILRADEYYVVRLRALDTDGNLLWSMSHWTQSANWRLPATVIDRIDGRVLLRWDVMVMLRTSKEGVEPITGEALSSKSEIYTIRFNK